MKRELPKNVYLDSRNDVYQVRFMRDGKVYYYGSYADVDLAIAVAQQVRSENFTASAGPPEIAKGMQYLIKYVDMKDVEAGERPAVRAAIKFIEKIETRGSKDGSDKKQGKLEPSPHTGGTANSRGKRSNK